MNFLRAMAGIGITLIGLFALWTCFQGLINGEIVQLAKNHHELLHRTTTPERYWIAIFFWAIGSALLLFGGLRMFRKNIG